MHESQTPPAKRPRLLVLASTYPRWRGDPEPGFVHELSKRLAECFETTVLCPHAPGAATRETLDGVSVVRYRYAPERLETLVNDGGIVTNLRRNTWKFLLVPGFVIAQAWNAWRILRKKNVDVLHAHWLIPQGAIAAMLRLLPGRSPPFVVTSHGADLYSLNSAMLKWLKRSVIQSACAVTVVSETMYRTANEIAPSAGNAVVQPMGVDLRERFTPDPATLRSGDEILFVGRLVEKKGLRHLLDAMPSILARRPAANLLIAGFGPEEAPLRYRVAELGLQSHVRFLGAVAQADLPNMYRRAALFVAPFVKASSGDQEGLGLVLVEAAGCGCPVLAGDVPAVGDVLGASSARIVDPRQADVLATAILNVLENPQLAREQASALREQLIDRFDWQNASSAYATILFKCVGAHESSSRKI